MAVNFDLAKALDALAIWKRLKPIPDAVQDLERRVAELEARLGEQSAGGLQQCPLCNSMQFKRVKSEPHAIFGETGLKTDTYQCRGCGHQETRERDEAAPPRR